MATKKKVRVSIELEFEDISDYKMHMQMVNERVKILLKCPDEELSREYNTGWSKHKFTIEHIDKE